MTAGPPLPAIRRIAGLALGLWSVALVAAALVALAGNPLAAPFVARSTAGAAAALERAAARAASPEAVLARLDAALAGGDRDAAALFAEIAGRHGIPLGEDRRAQVAAALAPPGWAEAAASCAACAWDARDCRTLAELAACALPVELSPAGDLNALRRQAAAHAAGAPVDRLEAGLALVGLAATAGVIVSGGASATLKAGAAAARLARRTGRLSPQLARMLGDAARIRVEPGRLGDLVAGRTALADVVDAPGLARLAPVATDLGRVAARLGPAEALALLPHVDTAADAARLARLAEVAGPATRGHLELLGKARAFRALVRVSDRALAAVALVAAALAQLGALAAGLALAALRRALAPAGAPIARPGRARHDRTA